MFNKNLKPFLKIISKQSRNRKRMVKTVNNVNELVCPLYKMDYPSQLKLKQAKTENCLRIIKNDLISFSRFNNSPITINSSSENPDLCCSILPIIESPQIYGYRNVVEFTCGYDLEGKIQIGFVSRNPVFNVMSPQDALNTSEEAKKISKLTCEFLETKSTSKPYSKDEGWWREIRIRQNLDKESTNSFLPLIS
jgi:tRNA/tmRNA/rRNA uracil-C5-methylase (TrmA/RlmC/RlmD family)